MVNVDSLVAETLGFNKEVFPPLGDFHAANAVAFYGESFLKDIYKKDYKSFKEIYRSNAKGVGLALCYGGSYRTIQQGIGVSEMEAKELHKNFFTTLSGFKKHIEQSLKKAEKVGYTKNLFGTILHIPELQEDDWKLKSIGIRHLQNYPIQSIAANLIHLVLLSFVNLAEYAETSIFAGDNVNKSFYTNIALSRVALNELPLDDKANGNILIAYKVSDSEIYVYKRPVALSTDELGELGLELLDLSKLDYGVINKQELNFNNPTNMKTILADLQQNILIPYHTVHDEVNVIVDSNLLEPVAKRLSELGAVKHIFDKIGIPYVNYLYDMEFDYDGSWLPKSSLNVREIPINEEEHKARDMAIETKPEIDVVTIKVLKGQLKALREKVVYCSNGVRLQIEVTDTNKIIKVSKLVALTSLEGFLDA